MSNDREGKGLIVSILEDKRIGNCSAGGVSATHSALTIVGVIDRTSDLSSKEVLPLPRESRVFEPREDAPAAVLVKRRLFGTTPTLHVEPLVHSREGAVMMGGSFVSSSDSRFSKMIGFYGAVPLHDRVEA